LESDHANRFAFDWVDMNRRNFLLGGAAVIAAGTVPKVIEQSLATLELDDVEWEWITEGEWQLAAHANCRCANFLDAVNSVRAVTAPNRCIMLLDMFEPLKSLTSDHCG
jgi:hypothetical protein